MAVPERMYNDPRDLAGLGRFLGEHGMPAERIAESVYHELRFALREAISHLVRLAGLGRAAEAAPGHWQAA